MQLYTYRDYLAEPEAISIEKMEEIHLQMTKEIENDPDAMELYEDLIIAATKYAHTRSVWPTMDRGEKMEKDSKRTSEHDSVIIRINALSRYLQSTGSQAEWRAMLECETDGYERKVIGDFVCYLAFICGIGAR
ncbi:MAG: hypothetical protein LUH07_11360 [Lachnospiraceae bacterium]|nr:hypothetical protein [Lachnospiraceae bacterium]